MVNKIIISGFIAIFCCMGVNSAHATNQPPPEWSQCTPCHVMGKKLIGPELTGVTERMPEEWLIRFIRNSTEMINSGDPDAVKIWEEYKIPMPPFDFTDEQIKAILAYIRDYVPGSEPEPAPVVLAPEADELLDDYLYEADAKGPGNTLPAFIIFLVLLIIAVVDLAVLKKVKATILHIIVIIVAVFVCAEILVVEAKALGRQHGYSPDQPVWFSHKVHAGQNKTDCLYCHHTANQSKSAGIPGTQVCMNCHNVVRRGTITGEEEIAKVLESWNTGKPIEWIRVNNMPDHVWFSHAQHVNAGKRECQECHGAVEKMDRIVQVFDLSMGWCLDCHKRSEVLFASNSFYAHYARLHDDIKSGKRLRITAENIGGLNCHSCHH